MQNWYYTSNGERQGPVSLVELEALSHRGRLDPQKDLVWTDGMTDWKLCGQVEGLFKAPSASDSDAFNPYAAPLTAADQLLASSSHGLGEVEPGSVNLDAVAVAKRAFELTKRNFGTLLAIGIIYIIILLVAEFGLSAIEAALGWNAVGFLPGGIGAEFPGAKAQHGIPGFILSSLFSSFLALGLVRCALNIVSGDEATVAMLFSQGPKIINTILASILYGLMVVAGLVLLIVPGIILALRFSMFQEAIIDRNLGPIAALKYSWRITQNNGFNLFIIGILGAFILLAGLLALLVGMIFAAPMVMLMTPLAYRFLQYGQQALTDHPGTETPSLSGRC
jgi:GYF domain 2